MFRKMIIGVILSLSAIASMATTAQINVDGLTDAQIAALKAMAANTVASTAKAATEATALPSLSVAATWGSQAALAAQGFAQAIGIAAKELGVTVNDFLRTDAGKLTAILIVWKVAGAGLVKMLFGVFFITVGLSFAYGLYRKLFSAGYREVTYSRLFGVFTGTKQVRITKSFADLDNEGEWMMLWIIIILVVLSLSVGSVFFTI